MANINQVASIPVPGGDVTAKNYGGSDIASGLTVKIDASNPSSATGAIGVVLTSDDTDAFGITLETIPAGKTGRVRALGAAVGTAGGTLTAGDLVMSNSSGKVVAQTTAKCQIGRALTSAVSNDPVLVWVAPAKNA